MKTKVRPYPDFKVIPMFPNEYIDVGIDIDKSKHITNTDTMKTKKLKWSIAIAFGFRKKRIQIFEDLLASLSQSLTILDVGGTQAFWKMIGFSNDNVKITVLNTEANEVAQANITSVVGDARDMHEFADEEFDVVFSNAVIEHVGTFSQQRAMAEEIRRVGQRYIIQTPNRYFPIEPHTLFPFLQFFPLKLKVFIATHTPDWGWKAAHIEELNTIRLMSEKELRSIFPGAKVYKEKFLGLTKSFILYKGW